MKKLLLHICCGPCSLMPVKYLRKENYEPIALFVNPNIQPLSEYLRRREAAAMCAEKLDFSILYHDVWDLPKWLASQLPYVHSLERCIRCCNARLEETAKKAAAMAIPCFSTSLLYSRYQPHAEIRRKGEELASEYQLEFVYRDFREYWQEGIELSKALEIYRQPYCGCVFSESERYAKKLQRLRKASQAPA